jgi:hypothetical protein
MSANISLYGLSKTIGEHDVPCVMEVHHEMGFGSLRDTLETEAELRPDLLWKVDNEQAGFYQYLVVDVPRLIERIRQNPHTWDGVGFGFDYGIDNMEKHPELCWWFHVCF